MEYTKQSNGKTVPQWSKQEVEEIVTAQVLEFFALIFLFEIKI